MTRFLALVSALVAVALFSTAAPFATADGQEELRRHEFPTDDLTLLYPNDDDTEYTSVGGLSTDGNTVLVSARPDAAPLSWFLFDRTTETYTPVPVPPDATGNVRLAGSPGAYMVVFQTPSSLVAEDINGVTDIYSWSQASGDTTLVSVNSAEEPIECVYDYVPDPLPGDWPPADWPPTLEGCGASGFAVSENGRFIVFGAESWPLLATPTPADSSDPLVRYVRDTVDGTTTFVTSEDWVPSGVGNDGVTASLIEPGPGTPQLVTLSDLTVTALAAPAAFGTGNAMSFMSGDGNQVLYYDESAPRTPSSVDAPGWEFMSPGLAMLYDVASTLSAPAYTVPDPSELVFGGVQFELVGDPVAGFSTDASSVVLRARSAPPTGAVNGSYVTPSLMLIQNRTTGALTPVVWSCAPAQWGSVALNSQVAAFDVTTAPPVESMMFLPNAAALRDLNSEMPPPPEECVYTWSPPLPPAPTPPLIPDPDPAPAPTPEAPLPAPSPEELPPMTPARHAG